MLNSLLGAMRGGSRGQMAFGMILTILVVFIFFALAFDMGLWYFDHRSAQNEAEAASLAAAIHLPDANCLTAPADPVSCPATKAAMAALAQNGKGVSDLTTCSGATSLYNYSDATGDGKADTIQLCLRRQSGATFAALSKINFAWVSASATARAGPANVATVMPWAVIAPDPTCNADAGRNCLYDANGNGKYTDPGDCNAPYDVCPFGLTPNRLYAFKIGTGGNTDIIAVCGGGASQYFNCLSGASSSGFFTVGETVAVNTQPGTIANKTDSGLQARSPSSAWQLPGGATCDSPATPWDLTTTSPGYDPTGEALARAKYINPTTNPQCAYRLIPVPITTAPGNGKSTVTVLGFAVFAVASWDRSNGNGDVYGGTAAKACTTEKKIGTDFDCGTVWGYLFTGVNSPNVLIEQMGGNNPFAPILVALID